MSGTVCRLRRNSTESLESLAAQILEKTEKEFFSPEVVISNVEKRGNVGVLLIVLEKYYVRNASWASLTLQCVSDGSTQTVTAVGTGGGTGILNIDWWANESFTDKICKYLEEIGFEECNI